MNSKKLRKAYNSLANGDRVNVRKMYGVGSPMDGLLPERAIEISQEDYQALFAMNEIQVEIRYSRPEEKKPHFKSNTALGMFAFTEIDGRFFASFPDAIWDLDMALMNEYIKLCEMFERIQDD